MAPVRRYLRITKHSVIEVRIYADRPQDVDSWLLRRGDPALPRIIKAIEPLVLPKLREESERTKSNKKASKKGLKDSVVQDDFEVSIFLTHSSVRHSLLTKSKTFGNSNDKAKRSEGKLTGWLTSGVAEEPVVVQDEDDQAGVDLANIPDVSALGTRKNKRKEPSREPIEVDESDEDASHQNMPASKRTRATTDSEGQVGADDKKKLAFNTSYDGFAIYGRILCLVVKRRGVKKQAATSQQMLEGWVSTQAAQDAGIADEREDG